MLQEEDNNIDLGVYGLGTVRTHKEYEDYAGINFKYKSIMEPATIVIDNGTGFTKMGYAGNLEPSFIIPSVIAQGTK